MHRDLQNITMTGRFCYVFMCIEKYLLAKYPEVDWKPIAMRMWQWTSHYWDESWDKYSEMVPEYILEFSTFEEVYEEYDGALSRQDYEEILACYKGITDGNENDEINRVIKVPIEMGSYCEGSAFCWAEPLVQEFIDELEDILTANKIDLPSVEPLSSFSFDRNYKARLDEREPGWGDAVSSEYLSVIL